MLITMIMRRQNPHENLVKGYLVPRKSGGVSALQPRHTLAQYFYTHMETLYEGIKIRLFTEAPRGAQSQSFSWWINSGCGSLIMVGYICSEDWPVN